MRAWRLALPLLLAGCAPLPSQEPAVQKGETVEVARFSRKQAGALPAPWEPWIILPSKPRTLYRLVETDAGVALEADAERAASGKYRRIRVDLRRHPQLEWRWRVPRLIEGADPRDAAREDSPVRLMVAFDGDASKLEFAERARMQLAQALSGQAMPYATLMYIWSNELPAGSVVHNPHTSRVRMIVVESGAAGLGRWRQVQRDVLADYRSAFGEEPGHVVAVGVMTDSDNTGSRARAFYGDISFRSRD